MTATLLNIRDYGATGAGVVSDSAAFTAALAVLTTAGGGTLLVPPGTYLVSSAINVPDNVTIAGAGPNSTTIRLASSANDSLIKNADQSAGNTGITVTGLTLDGHRDAQPRDYGKYGIWFVGCSETRIEDVEVRDVAGRGVALDGNGTFRGPYFVRGVHVHDCDYIGVTITYAARRSMFSDISTEFCGYGVSAGAAVGFMLDASQGTLASITSRYNNGHGIQLRNVIGISAANLVSEMNDKCGILLGGVVNSSGAGWRAHHNGLAASDTYDDVRIATNEETGAVGYGECDQLTISGLAAGPSPFIAGGSIGVGSVVGTTRMSRYALYVADGSIQTTERVVGSVGNLDAVGVRIEGYIGKAGVTGTTRRPAGSTTLWINGANS